MIFLTLALLPSFAWMIFFLKEDIHPEPKKMIFKVFLAGFFVTFLVIALQFMIQDAFTSYRLEDGNPFSLLAFALTEEVFKFLAAYLIVRKNKCFDEPVDAMIYMIVASLGFAMIENLAIMFSVNGISEAMGVITLRFVGATLLHALSSAIVGYWWAKGLIQTCHGDMTGNPNSIFWGYIVGGVAIAGALHAFFNYLIITSGNAIIYPVIFLSTIAMFIFWDFEKIKSTNN